MNTDPTILGTSWGDGQGKDITQMLDEEGWQTLLIDMKTQIIGNDDYLLQLAGAILYDSHGWQFCGPNHDTPIFEEIPALKQMVLAAIKRSLTQPVLDKWIRPDMRIFFVEDLLEKWTGYDENNPKMILLKKLEDF
ncbi:hypothetical protein LCGC14_0195920 [marine sediment metagenome]|uniref:Uncharacterized protein n=1 Tax=marine sediment metagenome TaxID=412755 RepID=A0A0F9UQ47_9ZZZZ